MTLSQSSEHRLDSQRFQTPRVVRRRPRGRRSLIAEKPVRRESSEIGATFEGGSAEIPGFRFAEPTHPAELTYAEWFREQILPSRRLTLFVAFYLHWIMLLCLAAIFLHAPEEFPPFSLNAAFSDEVPMDDNVLEIVETEFSVSELDSETANMETTQNLSALSASTAVPAFEQSPLDIVPVGLLALAVDTSVSAATGNSTAKRSEEPRPINVPGNAVSAGSFSVWTEPDNPDPGEPYKIVIQIRLPEEIEKYSVADLEGVVVGSDGYQKIIPGAVHGFLPVDNGQVRFEVHIVSADARVEDTVFIRSKLLREAQRLRIRF